MFYVLYIDYRVLFIYWVKIFYGKFEEFVFLIGILDDFDVCGGLSNVVLKGMFWGIF